MTEISKAVDACLKINGEISLNPYNAERFESLKSLVLWRYMRSNKEQITLFSDNSWFSDGNKLAITFNDIGTQYQYQLKALALGMFTQGSSQGMDPLAWSTIRRNIAVQKRLAKWLELYDIHNFSELEFLPELRLRNIVLDLVKAVVFNPVVHKAAFRQLVY